MFRTGCVQHRYRTCSGYRLGTVGTHEYHLMARKSKKTDDRRETIINAIRDGNTRDTAARLAGIAPSVLYDWMATDSEFSECIEKADAEAEKTHVDNIKKQADKGNLTASIYWLKARRNKHWNEKEQVEHSGDININVKYVKRPIKTDD